VTGIKARFDEISGLADTIDRTSSVVQTELDSLGKQVSAVTELWVGAASDGFQDTIHQWLVAADNLRKALRRLGLILHTTNGNHHVAVRTNTGMWPTR
jgi:WXG100 family type VII secretion target